MDDVDGQAGAPAGWCRFQDRQVVGANLRLASEFPLLVQARRIALGDRTPVVLANLGSGLSHWQASGPFWSSAGDYSPCSA
jgi:hypothetical protein